MYSILYVDDEPAFLDIARLYMERSGDLSIDTSPSAIEACKMLGKKRYDAVIADYQMPGMNGIEFLKRLRESGNSVPFIIFTGKSREEIVIQALNEGADFYLQKGVDAKSQFVELEHKVKQAVERKRTEDALLESETRFRELARLLPQIVFECDENLNLTFINEHASNLMGYRPEDLSSGINIWSTVDPSQVDRLKENMYRLMRGEPVTHEEYTMIRKDKSTFPALIYASPIFKETGNAGFRGVVVDIGPAKREDEYRKVLVELLDSAPEAISVHDFEGYFLYVNQRALDIHGYTREEYMSLKLQSLDAPRSRDKIAENMRILEEKGEISFEAEHIRKDGSTLPLMVKAKYADWGGKKVILSIATDITERKRMEQTIKESEERYRNIVEDQTEFISRFLPDGTHIFVNEAYCNYFGYKREDLLGHRFIPNIHPDDRKRVRDFFAGLTPENPVGSIDQRIIMSNGEIRWQQWSDRAIFNEHGLLIEYQSVGRDITELIQAEQIIRDNESKIKATIDSSPIPKFVIDNNHRIILWNRALEQLSGISGEEVLGTNQHWRAFYENERDCLADLLADGRIDAIPELYSGRWAKSRLIPDAYEATDFFPHIGENGCWLYFTAAIIRDSEGNSIGVAETLEDITERVAAEEALSQTNKKLNLLSNITRHDILNQISVLLGAAGLLREGALSAGERVELLNKIDSSSGIIKRHIEFTREYQDIGINAPTWQKLGRIIHRTLDQFEIQQIDIHIDIPEIEVYADPLFEKVFYNLIQNSLVHGENVSEIFINAIENPAGIVISVADNGIGISEEKKEAIFQRGFGSNTGFGLFLAREILDITGISIAERGHEGEGARFELSVPRTRYRYCPEDS